MTDKVGRNVSLIALITLLAILPFEGRVDLPYLIAQIAVLAGFLIRLIRPMRWQFWAAAVAGWLVSMGVFAGITALWVQTGKANFTTFEIFRTLLIEVGFLYFCIILVFLTQFVYRPDGWRQHNGLTKTILALAYVFALVVLISALCSRHPMASLQYVRKYTAPYLLIYLITVESLYSWRQYRLVITTIYLTGVITTSVSLTARYLYLHGGHEWKSEFLRAEILREEINADGQTELRNQWPFKHHNRLCSFALLVTLFVWLQFFSTQNWELKTLTAISTVVPVWCILVTLTRGGYVALAVAALALILMINWRSVWIFAAVAVMGWFVAPTQVRERLLSIFDRKTYTENQTTFGLRRQLWAWSLDIIRQHPLLGLGAGWEVFEDYIKTTYPERAAQMETPHAHNNFLEIAAESGLIAMSVFAAFTVALALQIGQAWRATQRQTKRRFVVAGFFALLIAITAFGITSYSLRYTIGLLIWVCFALMTLLPTVARAIPEEAPRGASAPNAV
ncbi:MAG: O-antigen ligase family protein [Candidatus Sumerlaeia bacterium]|nr:O-antigen ligase family protein [Candidatus Sumerlaeia bacterium]